MASTVCIQCGFGLRGGEPACPRCGYQMKPMEARAVTSRPVWGFEWRSTAEIMGWPLIHIAVGRNKETGGLMVARGIIAIGQFGIGLITIAQFGIGILFAFGQFTGGLLAIGQLALGVYFGLGQFATGITVIGQIAFGKYVLAQIGFGEHVWSVKMKDPIAIEYFRNLWSSLRSALGI